MASKQEQPTYALTEEAIRELQLDVCAATVIWTMKRDWPLVRRKTVKKRLMSTNFDPFGGGWYIPEKQAEDYMVRYWDIGHDIIGYNPKFQLGTVADKRKS